MAPCPGGRNLAGGGSLGGPSLIARLAGEARGPDPGRLQTGRCLVGYAMDSATAPPGTPFLLKMRRTLWAPDRLQTWGNTPCQGLIPRTKHVDRAGPGRISLQGKRFRVAGTTLEMTGDCRLPPGHLTCRGLRRLNGHGERPVDKNGSRAELLETIAGRTKNRKRGSIWIMVARRQPWTITYIRNYSCKLPAHSVTFELAHVETKVDNSQATFRIVCLVVSLAATKGCRFCESALQNPTRKLNGSTDQKAG